MTFLNPENLPLKIRPIRRKQLQQTLMISGVITMLAITGCSGSSDDDDTPAPPPAPPPAPLPSPKVPALFYSNTEQCEADTAKQQQTYDAKLQAYETKPQGSKPVPPVLDSSDCADQMAAAKREHDRHAPVYQTLAACEAEGVKCETSRSDVSGYRPSFGGAYLYPYAANATNSFAGTNSRVYQPYTVYQGTNAGMVMTPQGESVTQAKSGVVSAPQQPTVDAPARPAGYAAQGTISGRSQSGFGSTFKSTGSGGK